ncbi:DegT/DnrJ/EryC1/StrS aminotransferase family protein [Candidatus Pseudothioglobus singularis]|nr:DegT/DnrJ/EryC1/StrS aminotransferase family protein [Candidatus Pseudothioglobus singularis]MDB4822123.1 DegT/DnrJ/EryC1/StrS aminotransferase family protein [Candidatus Pseudothioglobus singularis]
MMMSDFSKWPSYSREEANAVKKVILSNKVNYWTGLECTSFEKEFSKFSDSKYSVAMSNGTVALDVAFKVLNISDGHEVIVTSRTFIASISSIVNAGAVPVFADVDSSSQNITPNSIRSVISDKTKAIVCVHLAGWPCDMDEIMAIANEHDLYVVEDCAQAHGSKYKGKSVGSFGHIGCWSFCQDKIMTTGGEGGMVTTNDESFWREMWAYKDHGKSYKAVYEREYSEGFRWLHESFGSNYRMTEMQAAIGRIQLKRMPDWHRKRLNNASSIWSTAKQCKGLRVPTIPDYIEHAAYKCYVFVKGGVELRDKIMREVNEKGVPCYSGSCSEVYLEKAFDNTGFRPKEGLPVARELGESSLMFLVHPTLTKEELQKTCDVLTEVVLSNYDS